MNLLSLNTEAHSHFLNTEFQLDELGYDKLEMLIEDAFIAGAKWYESLPLAEKLTEEEQEKIRAKYSELKKLNLITNDMFADDVAIFEWLFGTDMFTNKTE